ncbi:hypothetical protein D9M69_490330 [compost metagenome]
MIRLDDVRRRFVAAWFQELIILDAERDFVLRPGQRHPLEGLLGQWNLRHFPNALGHRIKRERPQLTWLGHLVGRQQGDRPGRLGTKVLQHPECIFNADSGTCGNELALPLFR